MKSPTKFSVLLTLLSIMTISAFSQGSATSSVKMTLPEFRDISAWKGRTGLTKFSPNGKFVAISAKTADIAIYNLESGKLQTMLDGSGFRGFSFSQDSAFAIAQNSSDFAVQIFEVETGKKVREIRGLGKLGRLSRFYGPGFANELNGIYPEIVLEMGGVPVSHDWKNIVVNKNDREFAIYDFDTGQLKYDLEHANFNAGWEKTKAALLIMSGLSGPPGGSMFLGSISNMQFSRLGKFLMITNGNKQPTLWNLNTGELVHKFDAGQRVYYSKFSLDETMVATSDYHGVTKIWNTETGDLLSTIGSKKDRGVITGWNADSTRVFIMPLRKGNLLAYAPQKGSFLYGFINSRPAGAIFSEDQKLLLTVPKGDKKILFQVWETDTGELIATVPRAKGEKELQSIKWSPDSQYVVTAQGLKAEVKIWDVGGTLLETLKNSTMPMQFSKDGRFLATGGISDGNPKNDIGYIWEMPAR